MKAWIASGALAMGMALLLAACISPDDIIDDCFGSCWEGSTFLRLDPPVTTPGNYDLTIKAGLLQTACRVTVPLERGVVGCVGSSSVDAWAHDDDSSDFAGLTLRSRTESVRVQITWNGRSFLDETVTPVEKIEGDCHCAVGRAVIPTTR